MIHVEGSDITKNVMFISHSSFTYGAEKSLLTLINNLPNDIRPIIVVPGDGPLLQQCNSNIRKYIVHYIPWLSSRQKFIKGIYIRLVNLMAVYKLKKICKLERINLIYTNTIATPVGLLTAKSSHLPHILHIREFVGSGEFAKFVLSENSVWKTLQYESNAVIANSESIANYYCHKIKRPIKVIYNGIEPIIVTNTSIVAEEPIVLMVGYIEERKNQEEALYALTKVLELNVSIKLKIAGGGDVEYINKLKKIIRNNKLEKSVEFLGTVQDIQNWYSRATCLIHCAKREPWGRVIVEAMLNRCIVIAVESDGIKEIIQNNVNGFVYNSGNVERLAELVVKVVSDKKNLLKIVDQAYEDASKRFSIDRYVNEVSSLIKECTN